MCDKLQEPPQLEVKWEQGGWELDKREKEGGRGEGGREGGREGKRI